MILASTIFATGVKIATKIRREKKENCVEFSFHSISGYLKGTQDVGIKYSKVDDFKLIGYSDSNFDGDKETGVSTSGYTMSLGSTAVSWRSRKQSVQADSTKEINSMAQEDT